MMSLIQRSHAVAETCGTCGGSGWLEPTGAACPTCNGTGERKESTDA